MGGGWSGGRCLRCSVPGRGGGRRPPERSPQSGFPASQFLQPGGSGGGAVALETSKLPVCGHFRILYAYVTSCFLPFTFFEASPKESRGTLGTEWFSVVFFLIYSVLFCLLSLTRAYRDLPLEHPVVDLAPQWRSQDCGSRS